ncbi:MAG: hypothetical protein H0T71_06560 [Acidobacteria bacterium]|nr:hypothetical protein [Acidobacteriota bacterium]
MKRLICAAAVVALAVPLAAQDKAAAVMQQARATLGGTRLEQVKALSLEGPFAREMGNRQVQGTLALTLQLPGNMHRSEDTEMMAGMSMERTSVLAGATSWEDMQNRGGMGGGMQIVMRGPGGPGGQELNAEQIEQARLRRFRTEFNRYVLAFLGGTGLQPTYVAVAEAPEGKADVLEVKNEAGQAVRIFVDQTTHMPLMLQYQEVRPRIQMGGRGGGPGGPGGRGGGAGGGGRRGGGAPPETAGAAAGTGTPSTPTTPATPGASGAAGAAAAGEGQRPNVEEMRRRMAAMPPPAPSTINLYLGDYKKVDGVMLPHRLTQAVDGKTVEEWTIEKVQVNPSVKADLFEKK